MTLPKQADVEIPLLLEIEKAGGKARPKDLYPRVTAHFPQITQEDLKRMLPAGNPQWTNRIQWVRLHLIKDGELDGSERGVWAITEAGRRRLDAHRKGIRYEPPRVPAKKRAKARARKVKPTTGRVDHDEIAHALESIGTAFGFDTLWKPKVNDLRPDRRAGNWWHLLRHTYAVNRVRAGATLWQLMAELGRTNPQTTMRYVNIARAGRA